MTDRYGAIRPAEPQDAERIAGLINEAFVVPPEPGIDAEQLELRDRWVLDGNDRLDATAWAMSVGQWVSGRAVPARAIAGVAVASDRRGVGAGRAIMTQLLERCVHEGAAIATLYPSTIGFYRSLGFGVAGHHLATRTGVSDLPTLRASGVDVVDKPDLSALLALYDDAARGLAGPLKRPEWWWDTRVFDVAHPGRRWTVVVRDGADIAGYAVVSKSRPTQPRPYVHDLTVHDTAWRTTDAARELLGYFRGFLTLGDTVRWPSPPGDHWLHLLTGPGPVPDQSSSPWMLRILDVPVALSSRGWPVTARGECVLDVTDDLIERNSGRWQLTIDRGLAAVSPTDASADLTIDLSGLAAAYTGWRSVSDLVGHGLATVADPTQLDRYDAWFSARPWLGERF